MLGSECPDAPIDHGLPVVGEKTQGHNGWDFQGMGKHFWVRCENGEKTLLDRHEKHKNG